MSLTDSIECRQMASKWFPTTHKVVFRSNFFRSDMHLAVRRAVDTKHNAFLPFMLSVTTKIQNAFEPPRLLKIYRE